MPRPPKWTGRFCGQNSYATLPVLFSPYHGANTSALFGGLLRRILTAAVIAASAVSISGCTQAPPPVSDKVAEYYSNPPTPTLRAELSSVSVIGDSYVSGSDMGGYEAANWVSQAQDKVTGKAVLINKGVGGSGYVTAVGGDTFLTRVPSAVNGTTDVVMFFGSRNDVGAQPGAVAAAASDAYAQVRELAPGAKIVVVGPAWVDSQVPEGILTIRDELKSAAQTANATFVDPVESEWFFANPELIGADGVHPTNAGHNYMAEKLAPAIVAALPKP